MDTGSPRHTIRNNTGDASLDDLVRMANEMAKKEPTLDNVTLCQVAVGKGIFGRFHVMPCVEHNDVHLEAMLWDATSGMQMSDTLTIPLWNADTTPDRYFTTVFYTFYHTIRLMQADTHRSKQ